ncbi:MAG: hypothetical protein LUC93_15030 [Planctomycetaceae bacterium]|nr:hypothetical protein [Planctomycetaceae bacterium]
MTDADPRDSNDNAREGLAGIYAGLIDAIGLTGREIAKLSGTRPQYISDIKRRQRPLSHEMFLRTLVGLYGDYKWLITGDLPVDTRRIIAMYPSIAGSDGPVMPLPLFQRPFMGPKMTGDDWDGNFMCVTSPVKEYAGAMRNPYILRIPFDDRSGRLRKGDFLLVNQVATANSAYVLVKSGWGVKLMHRVDDGFEDVETGDRRPDLDVNVIGGIAMLLMGLL